MKVDLQWTGSMKFTSVADGKETVMDAKSPIGQGSAMTPKELVGAGLAGCTAMDVIALFKKHKQLPESFDVSVDIQTSSGGYPVVFTHALLTYKAKGAVSKEVFIEAVTSSQTKYCGVSAMLAKAFPIEYKLVLNDEVIHEGQAHF
ncbi:MAG: hypothetical protein OM95_15885 [Bdellovibrio sp. ArHS]|uniref:OsmC family protein n=1 Tax=Bdellovibrio sp. ArHS TaxID=1569284 RepID=UPI0005832D87|nr:OsmC family protein [Bdellovibrio sp. ArHS]KHD87174.1 MAG: hypothetical protein OM95_15885 [Bdellovibrio sp. ArHS]